MYVCMFVCLYVCMYISGTVESPVELEFASVIVILEEFCDFFGMYRGATLKYGFCCVYEKKETGQTRETTKCGRATFRQLIFW